jgi:hypothetical protein
VRSRFSTSFKLVWDPGIILSFSLVQLVDHMVVMALFEDKQYLGREDCNVPIFGFPYSTVVDDLMCLCQPDHRGNLRLTVSSGGLEELHYSFRGPLIIFHHRDHSCAVSFGFRAFRLFP